MKVILCFFPESNLAPKVLGSDWVGKVLFINTIQLIKIKLRATIYLSIFYRLQNLNMARNLARSAITTLASAAGFDDIDDETRYFLKKVSYDISWQFLSHLCFIVIITLIILAGSSRPRIFSSL